MFDRLKAFLFDRCKRKKLETRQKEVLSAIRGERSNFEVMVQRAQRAGDTTDDTFLTDVLRRLGEFEQRANQSTSIDELDGLIEDAEQQGQLRAYICPLVEIPDEGKLLIDVMEEWAVPKAVIDNLRKSLVQKLDDLDEKIKRGALRAVFQEFDSWAEYIDDYEEMMRRNTYGLFFATILLSLLAIFVLQWPQLVNFGLLFAGVSGACVSVMAKMPTLDVSLSGELEAYRRRILSRIGLGTIASLIGCALLGWGAFPISLQNQTFADALNACIAFPNASCIGLKSLIPVAVAMLFGFSERTLTSFEQRVFGDSKSGDRRR